MDWLELLDKLAVPAAVGAGLIVAAQWSIGQFNNALALSLTVRRQAAQGASGFDDLVLVVGLKKEPPTRIRIESMEVTVRLSGPDGVIAPEASALAAALTASLRGDLRSSEHGIALVSGDQVSYEAPCRVPSHASIHIKVALSARQLIFEKLKFGRPSWSSSVVSLPVPPPPPSPPSA